MVIIRMLKVKAINNFTFNNSHYRTQTNQTLKRCNKIR